MSSRWVPMVAVLVLLMVWLSPGDTASVRISEASDPGAVDLVAIDMVNDVVATNEEDSAGAGTGAANCDDDADNDGDTLTDGDDPDCWENNEDSVGPVDGCGSIPNVGTPGSATVEPGTDLWFDLVVQGVDSGDRIMSYQFDIDYDPAIVEIIGVVAIDGSPTDDALGGKADGDISILSRIDSYAGSNFSAAGTESAAPVPNNPDSDGSFTVVGLDGTNAAPAGGSWPDMHEPTDRWGVDDDNNGVVDDAGEVSPDGVLARIRLRGIGAGASPLLIPSVLGGVDGHPDTYIRGASVLSPIASLQAGAVVVTEDVPASDADSDCISDSADNCPATFNPGQENADGDQWGDACDGCTNDPNNDADNDGICEGDGFLPPYSGDNDNCPDTVNPGQENADGDQWGDVCDVCINDPNNDADNDGICTGDGFLPPKSGDNDNCPDDPDNDADDDGICTGDGFLPPKSGDNDNCPDDPNPGQENNDTDSMGDACDPDDDNDGWLDGDDNCPFVATAWLVPPGDSDCDAFTDADEGVIGTDAVDNCAETSVRDDEEDDRWPSDLDDNRVINVFDMGRVLPPVFGSSPGAPDTNGDTIPDWSQRADIAPDGVINILDVGMVVPPYFGFVCTP